MCAKPQIEHSTPVPFLYKKLYIKKVELKNTRYEDVVGSVCRLRKEGKHATEICKALVQDAITKVLS